MNGIKEMCAIGAVKGGTTVHEFDGPVKIVVVDPPQDQFSRMRSVAAFIQVATMMIGANVAIVILFTLGFKLPILVNCHILLCTIGYQLCMPLAILMVHSMHGPSVPLKKLQRIYQHQYLNIFGMVLGLAGAIMVVVEGEPSIIEPDVVPTTTAHFYFGCITALMTLMNAVLGISAHYASSEGPGCVKMLLTAFHRCTGIAVYFFSSICFILGIVKPSMQLWLFIIGYMAPTYLIIFFTVFYTLIILVEPVKNLTGL